MDNEKLIKTTIATYDAIAEQYANDFFNNERKEQFAHEFSNTIKQGGKVLDVACGCGGMSKVLAENGLKVTGIDLSTRMLQIAKTNVPNVDFEIGDMRNLRFDDNEFDGLVAISAIIHLPQNDVLPTLQEFRRVLKPNGKLGLMLSIVDQSFERVEKEVYDPTLDIFYRHFSLDEIKELLKQTGFAKTSFQIEPHIDEDSGEQVTRLYAIAELEKELLKNVYMRQQHGTEKV